MNSTRNGWNLLEENTRLSYIQQTQTLLPITLLAGMHSSFYTAGTSLRGLFNLPELTWSANVAVPEKEAAQQYLFNIKQNMQKALTPEEYENILNHVNSYVQNLVDLKLQEQQNIQSAQAYLLTPQQTELIVALMRENLLNVLQEEQQRRHGITVGDKKVELNEAEVQRISAQVQRTLKQADDWPTKPLSMTAAHLAEIRTLIAQEIEVHNPSYYKLLVERIDLDALLIRILATSQLAEFVDMRISAALVDRLAKLTEGSVSQQTSAALLEQERLIDQLHSEMAFIKVTLSDRQSENADLQHSISQFKVTQENILERIQQHELATDKRFSRLLVEIETKLASLNNTQFSLLNKQVKLALIDILGFKDSSAAGNDKLDDIDVQNWVRSMFVAKEYLEQRLMELNQRTNNNIRDEIERSSMLLMRDISERLKREIIMAVETKHNHSVVLKAEMRSSLSDREVRNIVQSVLAIYDADKTGLVDFALESAGGQILSTRCTESYQTKSAQISVFGIPLWYPTNTPRVAISPNVQPGECWAFQGFPGFLVLKLNTLIYVSGFTLEHIPKSLSPTGRIDSAPKTFTVWGLAHEKDQDPVQFGEYEFVDNDASLQYFSTQNLDIQRPYQIVELRIESNHGESTYTCLYRFRVHGKSPAT